MLRYSDLMKYVPYQIVIKDVEKNLIWNRSFLKFDITLPMCKCREATMIFPKWKFKRAYLAWPTSTRTEIGRYNVFIEFIKHDRGILEFTRLERWMGQS